MHVHIDTSEEYDENLFLFIGFPQIERYLRRGMSHRLLYIVCY